MNTTEKTKSVISSVITSMYGAMIYPTVQKVIDNVIQQPDFTLTETAWVISHSGKQIVELPYSQAWRVHRKRWWGFSTIKPHVSLYERIFKHVRIKPLDARNRADIFLKYTIDLLPVLVTCSLLIGAVSKLFNKKENHGN